MRRDIEDEYETPMTAACPICGGPSEFLGVMGTTETYRCRDCGLVFQTATLKVSNDDELF